MAKLNYSSRFAGSQGIWSGANHRGGKESACAPRTEWVRFIDYIVAKAIGHTQDKIVVQRIVIEAIHLKATKSNDKKVLSILGNNAGYRKTLLAMGYNNDHLLAVTI